MRRTDHALKGGYCSIKVLGDESEPPAMRMPIRDAGGVDEFQNGVTRPDEPLANLVATLLLADHLALQAKPEVAHNGGGSVKVGRGDDNLIHRVNTVLVRLSHRLPIELERETIEVVSPIREPVKAESFDAAQRSSEFDSHAADGHCVACNCEASADPSLRVGADSDQCE